MWHRQAGKVIEASSRQTYLDVLRKNERVLVQLYAGCEMEMGFERARWCERNKRFQPEFQLVADRLRTFNLQTKLVKVKMDSPTGVDHAIEHDFRDLVRMSDYDHFQKLPILVYFFRGQRFAVYDGQRSVDPLADWLSSHELSAASELAEEEVEAYVKSALDDSFVLIARVKSGSARAQVFWRAVEAELMHDRAVHFRTAVVRLPPSSDGNRDSNLTMIRRASAFQDTKELKFTGSWTEEAIVKWALKRTYPSIGSRFDAVLYAPERLRRAGLDGIVVVLLDQELVFDPGRLAMTEMMSTLSKPHQQWRFLVIEMALLGAGVMDVLSVSGQDPAMVLVMSENRRYRLTGADAIRDQRSVGDFLARVKAKKEQPYLRSQLAPEQPFDKGLKVLTGNTFEQFVLDEARDVVVFFHTPTCEDCTQVLPVLQELANQGWPGVSFGKLDTSKNDCREEVARHPKVVLYPAVVPDRKMEFRRVLPAHAHGNLSRTKAFVLLHAKTLQGLAKQEL